MIFIIKQLFAFMALIVTFAFSMFIAFGLIALMIGLLELIKDKLKGGLSK